MSTVSQLSVIQRVSILSPPPSSLSMIERPGVPPRRLNIAVTGTRDWPDMDLVVDYIDSLPTRMRVLSGGGRGVDRVAISMAKQRGLGYEEILPNWEEDGKNARPIRNRKILKKADIAVVFWDGKSRGGKMFIEQANEQGVPVFVIEPKVDVEVFVEEDETPLLPEIDYASY